MEGQSGSGPSILPASIAGIWHLVDQGADEAQIPQHRMDLVFREDAGRLRGAIKSPVNGQELPLIDSVTLEGDTLRVQMTPPPGKTRDEMPFLVMRATGEKFEGRWTQDGTAVSPGLKLVRQRP